MSVIDVFARFARNHIDHRLTKPHGCSKAKRTNVRKRIKKEFSFITSASRSCCLFDAPFSFQSAASQFKRERERKKFFPPQLRQEETLFTGRQLATLAAISILGLHPSRKKIFFFFPSFFFEKTWNLRLAWCVDKSPLSRFRRWIRSCKNRGPEFRWTR